MSQFETPAATRRHRMTRLRLCFDAAKPADRRPKFSTPNDDSCYQIDGVHARYPLPHPRHVGCRISLLIKTLEQIILRFFRALALRSQFSLRQAIRLESDFLAIAQARPVGSISVCSQPRSNVWRPIISASRHTQVLEAAGLFPQLYSVRGELR